MCVCVWYLSPVQAVSRKFLDKLFAKMFLQKVLRGVSGGYDDARLDAERKERFTAVCHAQYQKLQRECQNVSNMNVLIHHLGCIKTYQNF